MTDETEMFEDVDGIPAEKKMSDGKEFHRSDALTENVRRPTVVSRNDGTDGRQYGIKGKRIAVSI